MGSPPKCLLAANGSRTKSSPLGLRRRVARKRNVHHDLNQECAGGSLLANQEVLMTVIFGIDPHEATHTAFAELPTREPSP